MRTLLLIALCLFAAGCKVTVESVALEQPISIVADEQPKDDVIDAGSPAPDVVEQAPPAEPKKLRNTVIQYTIKSCRWCDYDRDRVLPQWVKNGWNWKNDSEHVIDETGKPTKGAYPYYEIYDANGVKRVHKGSLLSWKN
jgi:hypothetical protein